jgi:hypothetical protein
MNVLPTVGISSYNELLKASAPGLFDIALYPPIYQRLFDVGTVFSFTAAGNISAQSAIVSTPPRPAEQLRSSRVKNLRISLQFLRNWDLSCPRTSNEGIQSGSKVIKLM